jgi:hypothetical protein
MNATIIKNAILSRPGEILFPADFMASGTAKSVYHILNRLVKSGEIMRLGKGIYVKPVHDPEIGMLTPSMDTIAQAIAKKDNLCIRQTGAYALNALGLSTQVVMNIVYLTDGNSRTIKIGQGKICFIKTNPRYLGAKNGLSYLVIQAFEEMGPRCDHRSREFAHLVRILQPFPPHILRADAYYASERVGKLVNLLADRLNPEITELPTQPMSKN